MILVSFASGYGQNYCTQAIRCLDMKNVSDAHSVPRQVSNHIDISININSCLPKISQLGRRSCASVAFYGLMLAGVLRMAFTVSPEALSHYFLVRFR